jgi:hypothetical protein
MTDDLVKRLKEGLHDLDYQTMLNPLLDEAADRIEQLEAALRKIADEKNWTEWLGWNGDEEPQNIARAALEKSDD